MYFLSSSTKMQGQESSSVGEGSEDHLGTLLRDPNAHRATETHGQRRGQIILSVDKHEISLAFKLSSSLM